MTFAKEKERRPDHFFPLKTLKFPRQDFTTTTEVLFYITFALPAPPRAPLTRTFLLCDWICFRNHALRVLSQPHTLRKTVNSLSPSTQTGARAFSASQYHHVGGPPPFSKILHSTASGDGIPCLLRHHYPTSIIGLAKSDTTPNPFDKHLRNPGFSRVVGAGTTA